MGSLARAPCGRPRSLADFGNAHWKGNTGFGSGPWVGADLEAGMYFGGGNATIVNNASRPLTSAFVYGKFDIILDRFSRMS